MDSSRRVWKWASAVLAVACAALVAANFLLTRLDVSPDDADWAENPRPAPHPSIQNPKSPIANPQDGFVRGHRDPLEFALGPRVSADGAEATERERYAGEDVAPASGGTRPDAGAKPRTAELKDNSALPDGEVKSPLHPSIQDPKSKIANPQNPGTGSIDNRQLSIINSIRPLGIVEKADGRVQAVIQEGEWVQIVEEGQVLADNSRVAKITAEAVELVRPPGEPSEPFAAKVAPARAGDVESPLRNTAGLNSPPETAAEFENNSALPLRKAAEFENNSALPNADFLGVVKHADGRVETVLADGQWVRLVREPSGPADYTDSIERRPPAVQAMAPPPGGGSGEENGGHGPPLQKAAELISPPEKAAELQDNSALPLRKAAELQDNSALQEIGEPIGIVEWPAGRVQAVVAQAGGVQLVEDAVAVADTRRVLAALPRPEGSGEDPAIRAASQPARAPDDEVASLEPSGSSEIPRGPPFADEPPRPEPDEMARGQPEEEFLAEAARPPPTFRAREDGFWEADLPGVEDAAATNIARAGTGEHPSLIISEGPAGVPTGGVPSRATPSALIPHQRGLARPVRESDQPDSRLGRARTVAPLGFVRWLDGRIKAVVQDGDSVILAGEGETLSDGSCVTKVEPGSVVIEPARSDSCASQVMEGGHAKGPVVHLSSHPAPGSDLLLGPALRDNRVQPRK